MKVELSEELRGVFEKLIPHYEKCIEELPLDNDKRYDFLLKNEIYLGICRASTCILGINIYKEMIDIITFLDLNKEWFEYPCIKSYGNSKKLLQLRVDAMKSLLKNGTIKK